MGESSLEAYLAERPRIALILGSGLGAFADRLEQARSVPYSAIPGLPESHVAGHAGRFVSGRLGDVPLVLMQGRVHLYEGWSAKEVVKGTQLMLDAGAQALIVTNAAGGIRTDLTPNTLMLIEDHLNLTGQNCLVGANEDQRGPRFPDMGRAYCPTLRQLALECAQALNLQVGVGVYAGMLGPSYETPAEIRMLQRLGADAVGMSTVQEVLAAAHRGVPSLGISCITNPAAGLASGPLLHEDVQQAAAASRDAFGELLEAVIPKVAANLSTAE